MVRKSSGIFSIQSQFLIFFTKLYGCDDFAGTAAYTYEDNAVSSKARSLHNDEINTEDGAFLIVASDERGNMTGYQFDQITGDLLKTLMPKAQEDTVAMSFR